MTDTVRQTTGGQPQRFSFALPGQPTVLGVTAATNNSAPIPKDGLHSTYQAHVRGTSGTISATVTIQATDDPHTAGADDPETGERNNFQIVTTNTSTAITSPEGLFRAGMDGDEVYAVGVAVGTTMLYVSPTSATLSSAATASGNVPARFQSTNWTLLGTITVGGTIVVGGAKSFSDGFATMAAWKWTRAVVSAISGTGATAFARQGV